MRPADTRLEQVVPCGGREDGEKGGHWPGQVAVWWAAGRDGPVACAWADCSSKSTCVQEPVYRWRRMLYRACCAGEKRIAGAGQVVCCAVCLSCAVRTRLLESTGGSLDVPAVVGVALGLRQA